MRRHGKIFMPGLLTIYLLAALTALIVLTFVFLGKMPDHGIGSYQAAVLSAYDRADQKTVYAEQAAAKALREAFALLYTDQASFFGEAEGDGYAGLECGSYAYQLWNDGESCLVGDGADASAAVLEALEPKTIEALGRATMAFPSGGFDGGYSMETPVPADGRIKVRFTASDVVEPIFVGLAAEAPAAEIDAALGGGSTVAGLAWPSPDTKTITSCFGPRVGVRGAASNRHAGMDIQAGSSVIAAADGKVMNDPSTSRYGVVWVQHSDKLSTRYLHLDKSTITVKRGDSVRQGQVLGTPSNTGCAAQGCPVHLHFEVLIPSTAAPHAYSSPHPGWSAVNPACFFPAGTLSESQIAENTQQSCRASGYPRPAISAYCAEYGIAITEAHALTPGTAIAKREPGQAGPETAETPAVGDDPARPTNQGLKSGPPTYQQEKFAATEKRRYDLGWDKHVIAASAETGISQALLLAIITQESVGDPDVVSSTGCAGLMQICKPTGEDEALLKGRMVACGTDCKARGNCACTPANDLRFNPAINVAAGASVLKKKLTIYKDEKDQLLLGIAAYNVGQGIVSSALKASGGDSWADAAEYLEDHPELITYEKDRAGQERKVREVTGYVENVRAFAEAWNGGKPIDAGHADAVRAVERKYGDIKRVGEYTFRPSVRAETDDALTPFLGLVAWADAALEKCASADVPGECLLSEAKAAEPPVKTVCEEDPAAQYFLDLYAALRDCAENAQFACQCGLPPLPNLRGTGTYLFTLEQKEGAATLTKDGVVVPLSLVDIQDKTFRAGQAAPEELSVKLVLSEHAPTLTFAFKEVGAVKGESWPAGWVAEKGAEYPRQLIFRKDASGAPLCAPVKTKYALCSDISDGMPAAKFALTVKDEKAPDSVRDLTYDPATKKISFTPSSSKDVSFYNVYDGPLGRDAKPVLQLRGSTSFDASALAGKTLSVVPVDRAGREGSAVRIEVPAQI